MDQTYSSLQMQYQGIQKILRHDKLGGQDNVYAQKVKEHC